MDGGDLWEKSFAVFLREEWFALFIDHKPSQVLQKKKMDEKSRFHELLRAISEFIESEIQFYRKNLTLEASL